MKKLGLGLFLIGLCVGSVSQAQNTKKYNECVSAEDSETGIYFENGFRRPSTNASEHYFEQIVLIKNGIEVETYMIAGDNLYRASCPAEDKEDAVSVVSLTKDYYKKLKRTYACYAKGTVEVEFDLSSMDKVNGSLTIRNVVEGVERFENFKLICGK